MSSDKLTREERAQIDEYWGKWATAVDPKTLAGWPKVATASSFGVTGMTWSTVGTSGMTASSGGVTGVHPDIQAMIDEQTAIKHSSPIKMPVDLMPMDTSELDLI